MNLAPLKQCVEAGLDLFFPRSCVACGKAVEGSPLRHCCHRCARRIAVIRSPRCQTCGYPFFGQVEGPRQCPHCLHLDPAFERGWAAVLYQGPARDLVRGLKYEGTTYLIEDARAIFRMSPELVAAAAGAVLVPVPLHPRKQRERGYNQAELLAGALAAEAGGARMEKLLRREVDTPSQTRLDRAKRQENLKNAFALAPGVAISPSLLYMLVDDVFTTGSTLNACARTLRRAGAESIQVATFGHG
jgi:ComF family protein